MCLDQCDVKQCVTALSRSFIHTACRYQQLRSRSVNFEQRDVRKIGYFRGFSSFLFYFWIHICQGRNHGIDIGGVQMWALPQIIVLSLVADQIVKTNRPVHQRMNRGLSMEWEVRELLGLWLQRLFSLFSGYNASYLAVILSHLNVILFHIYSKISAVFLTMALLFRCLLAYRLKKRRMSACSSCFFLLAPTFILFKHQWQSDWAVFSNDAASRRLRAQPSVQSRGVVTPFCFPCFF